MTPDRALRAIVDRLRIVRRSIEPQISEHAATSPLRRAVRRYDMYFSAFMWGLVDGDVRKARVAISKMIEETDRMKPLLKQCA